MSDGFIEVVVLAGVMQFVPHYLDIIIAALILIALAFEITRLGPKKVPIWYWGYMVIIFSMMYLGFLYDHDPLENEYFTSSDGLI